MQMGEASTHRPGDYGRWERAVWGPPLAPKQEAAIFFPLLAGAGWESGGMGGGNDWKHI